MPATTPIPELEPPEPDDRSSLLTSVFSVSLVISGLSCYILSSYAVPVIEASGHDGLVVYAVLFLGGLLGLLVALAPLAKPSLAGAGSGPTAG
ncbi:MAG: hypothetical protein O2968_18005 [Acidobacteria bacterium]|nr:hypothetical protein [Acidobacteriota bacterium]